jgi:hypothetical protein
MSTTITEQEMDQAINRIVVQTTDTELMHLIKDADDGTYGDCFVPAISEMIYIFAMSMNLAVSHHVPMADFPRPEWSLISRKICVSNYEDLALAA